MAQTRSMWEVIRKEQDIPDAPGCYVLCGGSRAYYIGQSSTSVRNRITQHGWIINGSSVATKWGTFRDARIKVKCCSPYGEWLMLEARLIRRLSPTCNKKLFYGVVRSWTGQTDSQPNLFHRRDDKVTAWKRAKTMRYSDFSYAEIEEMDRQAHRDLSDAAKNIAFVAEIKRAVLNAGQRNAKNDALRIGILSSESPAEVS